MNKEIDIEDMIDTILNTEFDEIDVDYFKGVENIQEKYEVEQDEYFGASGEYPYENVYYRRINEDIRVLIEENLNDGLNKVIDDEAIDKLFEKGNEENLSIVMNILSKVK